MMTFKEELEKLLSEELKVCKELKNITFKKTDILVNNEIENLSEITEKEEELINTVALLEEGRQNLLDSWGIAQNISLLEIISKIPEDAKSLEDIGEELAVTLQEINVRNQLNGELLRDSLEWIDFNINLISNTEAPTTYGKDNKKVNVKNNLFDRKV